MSKNQLKADDVTGFVRAFVDEIRETEMRYGVACQVIVMPGSGRGGITLIGTAIRVTSAPLVYEYARAERQWPSDRYTSLHGLLYALAMSLNIACQRRYHDENGHFLSDAPANGSES